MASLTSEITVKFDDAQLRRLESLANGARVELAFKYLLDHARCTCKDQSRINRVHDDQCVLTVAIEIHDGLRDWPVTPDPA